MNMNLFNRLGRKRVEVNAQNQMAIHGEAVVFALLFARKVPMRVKPMRIARGEQKTFGAVGFGQFTFGFEFFERWSWPKRITLAGAADRWRGWFIAFEQDCRNPESFFCRNF